MSSLSPQVILSHSSSPAASAELQQSRLSGLAVAGFIFSFIFALGGLILSIRASRDIADSNGHLRGSGLATAGVFISLANMLIGLLMVMSTLAHGPGL